MELLKFRNVLNRLLVARSPIRYGWLIRICLWAKIVAFPTCVPIATGVIIIINVLAAQCGDMGSMCLHIYIYIYIYICG